VLGAPEIVGASAPEDVRRRADDLAAGGSRVVLLSRASTMPTPDDPLVGLTPVALIVISQQLRPDAAQTVSYFLDQGVTVKVISGDNAATVGAIAARAGVPGADHPVDARDLPDDPQALAEPISSSNVFGRVTPLQKQQMVAALHLRESTVAMTGDGVNDVLALKKADLGIAMGSGSGATRAVAQLVLLDDKWSVMPSVVAEGRRVLGNIERVSDVFLTKTAYSVVFSVMTGLFAFAFPFLPRHLTLISALTIGIPGFFLALMPNTERFRPGFLRRVLLFAVPSGVICASSALISYTVALRVGEPLANAQAAACVTLFIVAVSVLAMSARPLNAIRLAIVGSMVAMFLAVLFIPFLSRFFALSLAPERYSLVAVVTGFVGAALVWVVGRYVDRWRRPPARA
jgi:cation-transporting ATPase E